MLKHNVRRIVTLFASSEFAFIYCIVGTLAQVSHTYYLVLSISSLDGWGKHLQAFMLSLFISSSLLFFTAIADSNKDDKDSKRILMAVNLFMVIEIVINIYYYLSHLVLKASQPEWFDFIFALLVSCMIPVTIKLYAGVIKAKEWMQSEGQLAAEEEVLRGWVDTSGVHQQADEWEQAGVEHQQVAAVQEQELTGRVKSVNDTDEQEEPEQLVSEQLEPVKIVGVIDRITSRGETTPVGENTSVETNTSNDDETPKIRAVRLDDGPSRIKLNYTK